MEWKFNKAFGTLMSYSLVRPLQGEESVEMHLLVQNVIQDDENTDKLQCFMQSAELVGMRFPWGGDANNLKGCRRYLSQAQNCIALAEKFHIQEQKIQELLESIATYYWLTGQFADSLVSYQKALQILPFDHIKSANTIMGVGLVYDSQGKYAEAISWYERALKIFEREFGVDHINSANTIGNIGGVL